MAGFADFLKGLDADAIGTGVGALANNRLNAGSIGAIEQFLAQAGERDPQSFGGPGGQLSFGQGGGQFSLSPQDQVIRQAFQQQALAGVQGQGQGFQGAQQLFSNPAFTQQQQALGNQFNFDPSQLQALQGGVNSLFGTAGANFAGGPTDPSGQVGGLFNRANSLLNQDNFDQRQGEVLSDLRAQAAPQEQRDINRLGNALFGTGQRGTTGGQDIAGRFQEGLGQADLSRQLASRGVALNEREADRGLAQGLFSQGFGGVGQGLQFNLGQGQIAQGFAGQAGALQGQGFGQALSGQQQNLSQGQQRLANATSLFGIGQQARTQDFQNALAGSGFNLNQAGQGQNLFLNALGADSSRMNAQAGIGQQMNKTLQARMLQNQDSGGLLGGLVSGGLQAATMLSDRRLKTNVRRYKTINGIEFVRFDWRPIAATVSPDLVGADFGVIAQQVMEVDPQLVYVDDRTDYLKVDYAAVEEYING